MSTGRNIFSEKPSTSILANTLRNRCSNIKIPEQDFLLFETRAGLTETKYRGSASAKE